jgi:hypothetical protein
MHYVERFILVGSFELGQSLKHQVSNTDTTHFSLLHLFICGIELGALLLDESPPFGYGGFAPVTLEWVITQVLVPMEVVKHTLPKYATLLLGTTS